MNAKQLDNHIRSSIKKLTDKLPNEHDTALVIALGEESGYITTEEAQDISSRVGIQFPYFKVD